MGNSVIRSDGTAIWIAEWLGETGGREEELDDIFGAYRAWYEVQVRDENEDDCIPLRLAG